MYFLLFYDYVDNVVDRRAPFRAAHLDLVRAFADRGELVLAGAFDDPVDGAALAFKVNDRAKVEDFVANDPYVAHGLVTGWRIRPWTVVVGSALQSESGTSA